MTIEKTVAILIESQIKGLTVSCHMMRRRSHLSDYAIRVYEDTGPRQIFKFRAGYDSDIINVPDMNIYDAIKVIKRYWNERYSTEEYTGIPEEYGRI